MDKKKIYHFILTLFSGIVFCVALGISFFHPIPTDNKEVVYTAMGVMGTIFVSSWGYWFNSTHSSEEKTNMINNSTPIKNG